MQIWWMLSRKSSTCSHKEGNMGFLDILTGSSSAAVKGNRVADALPYEELYADGTILTKDWGLMKCWHVDYPDTSMSLAAADDVSERIARAFHNHPYEMKECKTAYWFIMERVPMNISANAVASGLENMKQVDYEIEQHRMDMFRDMSKNNMNKNFVCCKVQVSVDSTGITAKTLDRANSLFRQFEAALSSVNARPEPLTCTAEDPDRNIMTFLKYITGTDDAPFKCPPNGMKNVSDFLSTKTMQKGKPMIFGDKYVQALTIDAFPSETYANILILLQALPFCFRWSTRWIPRNNWDSQEMAKKMRREFRSGVKSWRTVMYENSTGLQSDATEAQAVTDVAEMEAVLNDLTHGETIGEMTSMVILIADSIEEINAQTQQVKRVMLNAGFDVIDEDRYSNFAAWRSSLPGDSIANRRKPFVTATNISHIIPFTDMYHGSPVNYYLKRLTGCGWPHVIGKLRTNELYYLNLNGPKDDVGHFFVIGSTGGGKSVLLGFLATQWMRYPNSRVIYFDKDMSFANICRRSGGAIYVPSAEDSDLSFMPLSRIREKPAQAVGWLEIAVQAANVELTPQISKDLMSVAKSWDLSEPTLERFTARLRGYNPESEAIPVLERILDDNELSKLFGGEKDEFNKDSFRRETMIEMGPLMNLGDQAVLPALQFMFDRMDELFDFDPQPTLLILDEAWKFLSHPVFRKKIKDWLKTLRKKRVFVGFAMQNIGDIDDAEEFLTSCHTRIFLPNHELRGAGSESIKELYRKIGLADNELEVIGYAERKAEYYISQTEGAALVNFDLDQYQLERIARDGY